MDAAEKSDIVEKSDKVRTPKHPLRSAKRSAGSSEQLRRAQQTYRQKKESLLQSTRARVTELESQIDKVAEALDAVQDIIHKSELSTTHSTLVTHVNKIENLLAHRSQRSRSLNISQSSINHANDESDALSVSSLDSVFGYRLGAGPTHGHSNGSVEILGKQSHKARSHSAQKSCLVNEQVVETPCTFPLQQAIPPALGSNTKYSYCFQERTFSRRLQRFCLEHTFQMFEDPRSDPTAVYRMFRLVPCIQDKAKMSPYFRRLLDGGINDPLEIRSLPFYGIGGAGTHFPTIDKSGNPVSPSNTRLPRRVLGILPVAEPEDGNTSGQDRERYLEILVMVVSGLIVGTSRAI
ncbi:hypothetical protein Z517_08241 [Fonsecaea pedrosoi CBS 271.37]|uniref:BZIP domain-containing protein n=1 Tax=Fonsecaea pedrosoi CBS 271.37 TaxID=1442368 RepID=A0A0D2GIN2_9EURO|nr:uncharacterized protein Z517_08241 [Fonsecaea pedrosoi CBS 271.37]KIW78405.1 hypothetical protein Z517_08241 [Fonsecaea pedrosoi CBS 271.37]